MPDLRDLMLEVQAGIQETVQEVMDELLEPQLQDALRLRWDTVPDEMKELLKQTQPETYRRLLQMMEG